MQEEIANILLDIGAVKFVPKNPRTFKSGIVSPVYVDNRSIPFFPSKWKTIIQGFQSCIESLDDDIEIIAGIEAAAIPHSAALGYQINLPSVFVRKQAKEHGEKKRVEGGDVQNRRILLVEDLVTTGRSSLTGVNALRYEGAIVNHCIAIVSYGFKKAIQSFVEARVQLHTLTTFRDIIECAIEQERLSEHEIRIINDWLNDPYEWANRHG